MNAASDVTRWSYPADLYRAVHTGLEGDVTFYRRAATEAHTVLELGAGFGRIAGALSNDGKAVMGVERDPDLLALAEPSGAALRVGDMRTLDLDRRFDRIIIPYNGLYCLLTEADVLRTLEGARRHLMPGGLLVFDVWCADAFHWEAPAEGPEEFEWIKTVQARGRSWEVHERTTWDRSTQRLDATYRHAPDDGGEPVLATIPQRYLLSDQVTRLLDRAGLQTLARLGAFDDSAFDEDSELMIVVAENP